MNIGSLESLQALGQTHSAERMGTKLPVSFPSSGSSSAAVGGPDSFGGLIQQFVQQSNSAQRSAENSISDFVSGKSDNIQNVAIAMANAEMSFKFLLEIRNKVIESFNDLMRMPF